MSKSKVDFEPNQISIETHHMNVTQDYATELGHYLPIKDTTNLVLTSKRNYTFYKPILDIKKETLKALTGVVEGNPDALKEVIKIDQALLFTKYPIIKAPRGQHYFNCSAFQLIKFLCDKDMDAQVLPLLSEKCKEIRNAQYAEIDCGGADIIKLDRNPLEIMENQGFKGLTQYKTTVNLFDGTQPEVTFPLLENPDGIICYQDENNKKQFFYANLENQTILPFNGIIAEENQLAYEQFKKSFDAMEKNSSRRSSEEEHQMIAKILNIFLVRKGIFYTDNGILYRDSHTPFNLVNVYRKCIRLYEEAEHNNEWEKSKYWHSQIGEKYQGEEIWLLQRICEKNKPFYPFNLENFTTFNREGCVIYNYETSKYEAIFENGVIKISDFAIYRAPARMLSRHDVRHVDLVTICWLIEDAKSNTIEFKPVQEVQLSCTTR